jgi:hypothetical protein
MIVNGNHFQFDCKSLFNFWKTNYNFKNHKSFSEFKLFIIAGTFMGICHLCTMEFVGSPNLLPNVSKFWYLIAVGFQQNKQKSGRCRNLELVPRNLVTSGTVVGFHRPYSSETGRNLASTVEILHKWLDFLR